MIDQEAIALSPSKKKKKKERDLRAEDENFTGTPKTKKSKKKIKRKKDDGNCGDETEKTDAEKYMQLHMSAFAPHDSYNWANSSIGKSSSTAATVSTEGSSIVSAKSPKDARKNKITVRKLGEMEPVPDPKNKWWKLQESKSEDSANKEKCSRTASFSPVSIENKKKKVPKDLIRPKRNKSDGLVKLSSSPTTNKGKVQKLRTSSGCGLDELMKQSVHDHTRKQTSEKPSLVRSKSGLGAALRRCESDLNEESSGKKLKRSSSSLGGLKRSKSSLGDFFRKRSDSKESSSPKSLKRGEKSKLPKNVREIDGIFWKVDDDGNKLEKINPSSLIFEPDEGTTISSSAGSSKSSRKNKHVRRKSLRHDTNVSESDVEVATIAGNSLDAKLRRKNRKIHRKIITASVTDQDDDADKTIGAHSLDAKLESRLTRKIRSGRRKNSNVPIDDWSVGSGVESKPSSSSSASRSKSVDRRPAIRGRTLKMTKDRLDDSQGSLYLDEIPSKPKRSNSKGKYAKGKKKNRHLEESIDFESSASSQTHTNGDPIVVDLQTQLMSSRREVWRLKKTIEEQSITLQEMTIEKEKMKEDLDLTKEEAHNLGLEIQRLQLKLELREQDLERAQKALDKHIKLAEDRPAESHLIDQITDLMNENNSLVTKMSAQKAEAGMRLQKKDEEVRYLQMELDRMRGEKGEQDFEIQTLRDVVSKQQREGSLEPTNSSLQLVDKLWKQRKDASDKAQRQQIQDLQERVDSLLVSNKKLKKDLEQSTLEINSDDDDELRKAKEMAEAVSRGHLTRTRSAKAVKRKLARSRSPGRLSTLISRSKSCSESLGPTLSGASSAIWSHNRVSPENYESRNDRL